jgi:photosystem II stability/assembly factor-like uncharacterized protein
VSRTSAIVAGLFVALVVVATGFAQAPSPVTAYKGRLATKAPLLAVAPAASRLVAVGDYGVILLSDDAGATWRQAEAVATRSMLTAVAFADARRGWSVGHGGIVLHTTDGGENWALQHAAGADVTLLSVWFENASRGIAVGAFGHALETNDGGRTWTKLAVGEGDDRDRHLNGIFAIAGGPLIIAAESGTVFRSADNGKTWVALRLPYAGSVWGGMPLSDGSAIVYGMRGHVLHTADQGRTWSEVPTGADQSLTAGIQLADGTVVLVGLGGVLAWSRDGRSFQSIVRPERQNYAAVGAGAPGRLVVAGLTGVASLELSTK